MNERLQKLIACSGYGSRRSVEYLIIKGRVKVNNKVAVIGDKASIKDDIRIDNKKINLVSAKVTKVIIVNKKIGIICSHKDEKGRQSVYDLLPPGPRWVMVGRLDINSSGLLLFTNNGDLANRLMHPSFSIEREYIVRVFGRVSSEDIQKLKEGVELEDGIARFKKIIEGGGQSANRWYKVVLTEGKKREVRRLWEALGFKVSRLIRVRFGNICMPDFLRANQHKYASVKEVNTLLQSVKLKPINSST